MDIGILIPARKRLREIIAIYKMIAEDIKPEFIWIPDRLACYDVSDLKNYFDNLPIEHPFGFHDPFLIISIMQSAANFSPKFGIAVTDFIRRTPVDLARSSDTLGQYLAHPLQIGFGAGEAVNLNLLGYTPNATPVSFLERNLIAFRKIISSGYYSDIEGHKTRVGYNSTSHDIWIGGQRERMLKITAKYADGWLPAWKMDPLDYAKKTSIISDLASKYQRRRPIFGMFGEVYIAESKNAVFDQFQAAPLLKYLALQAQADTWEKWGLSHPAGRDTKGLHDVLLQNIPPELLYKSISSVPPHFIGDLAFVGSVDNILDELWQYKLAGMEHIALAAPIMENEDTNLVISSYANFKKICNEIGAW